jgi:hypothetical protein
MDELRDHRRAGFEGRAWCESSGLTLYVPVSNVSRGGMFLQTVTPLPPGSALQISFEAGEHEKVVAGVEVVWSCRAGRSSGVGCRVLGFLEGAEAYERLVRSLSAA